MSHLIPNGPLSRSKCAFSDLLRLIWRILRWLGAGWSRSDIKAILGVGCLWRSVSICVTLFGYVKERGEGRWDLRGRARG